jgi:putative membrane protein
MTPWTFEPYVVISLGVSVVLYAAGMIRCRALRKWQAVAFLAGWTSLVIALVSPLDALSEIFFSAHMAQHEILMIIAAPLIVLGRPLVVFLWALPAKWRTSVGAFAQTKPIAKTWHAITGGAVVTILHALALWIWHIPSLYQATLHDDFIHGLQHISFFGTAALFWWALMHGRYGRIGYGMAVLYVFLTAAHSGALGALITFSTHVWYPIYGANAIEDQQLAGLIMWVPAGVWLAVLGIALFAAWLAEAERRVAIIEGERKR